MVAGVEIAHEICRPISRPAKPRLRCTPATARSRSSRASPCARSLLTGRLPAPVRSSGIDYFLFELSLRGKRFRFIQIILLADSHQVAGQHIQIQSAREPEEN